MNMNTIAAQQLEDQPDISDLDNIRLDHMDHFDVPPIQSVRPFCLRSYTEQAYGPTKSRPLYGGYLK